jgi:hypothetical protein
VIAIEKETSASSASESDGAEFSAIQLFNQE